ncbi:TIGR03087 family PEP-CTERM/XrtA system glycosyltransferase [Flocculibacter collagenilyticus]|uniref:TIGR03087 family PEP-CTERM/XrtA system glycosyltransferase n=1 Tax=Flocculibacter collagenilyticus TaxID=2744479 RepID=UPI0018F4FCBC|nr:TIGR03087 family PEP-CTERM/XrtA system glycosyltransferase [Flocculibacter collagenilyticus]
MPSLLYLCHRIPFPPNKGDKIRSFNILKFLSQHFDIYLGCFIDDPFDWQYTSELDKYCREVKCINLNKKWATVRSSRALLSNAPLSVPYYHDGEMQNWVNDICANNNIEKAFIFSSSMAQYIDDKQFSAIDRIIDFVDIDSDKWRQYAKNTSGIMKWVYQREFKTLARYEHKITDAFDHSVFVSPQEASQYQQSLTAPLKNKVHAVLNGVNQEYFDITSDFDSLEQSDTVDVVFTGAMDYWANVDAVVWFCTHIWPSVLEQHPDTSFYIVGGNPTAEVKALETHTGVTVTGRVADVRPYLAQAKVAVTPLQIARGIQNKLLEAMSMQLPVVTTSMALEGIETNSPDVFLADTDAEFAGYVNKCLAQPKKSAVNRRWIEDNFQWSASLAPLQELLNGTASSAN